MPQNGVVRGDAVACGTGQSSCNLILASAGTVALRAEPDAGYVFAGWSGSCSGDRVTSVVVNGPTACGAAFEAATPALPRRLLLLHSEPGDTAGGGQRRAYSAATAMFTADAAGASEVTVAVVGTDGANWRLRFRARSGDTLKVGTYADASGDAFGIRPYLDVQCYSSRTTGRFIVRDIAYGGSGQLLRFAADFEQHCSDAAPGLFGIIRYDSSAPETAAFAGAYPDYRLDVETAAGGRISGEGIACGLGDAACSRVLSAAAQVTLTAAPADGHIFTGWTGACHGTQTTTVHVNGPKRCVAMFEPVQPANARTLLQMDSQAGDYIGRGQRHFFADGNSRWTVTQASAELVDLAVDGWDGSYWQLSFAAPAASPVLVPGLYAEARRTPFRGQSPGLNVTGNGSGCNTVEGRFTIRDIAFGPGNSLLRFAADFEQHCEGQTAALYGALRYQTTVPAAPAGGPYPRYELSLDAPEHGTIVSTAIACGSAGSTCVATFPSATVVTLEARADSGFEFAGWSGACAGGSLSTTIRVYGQRSCGAAFVAVLPDHGESRLAIRIPASGYAAASSALYHSSNATLSADWPGGGGLRISSAGHDGSSWRVIFRPAPGGVLIPGTYAVVASSGQPSGPTMSSDGDRYCSSSMAFGRFAIHEYLDQR